MKTRVYINGRSLAWAKWILRLQTCCCPAMKILKYWEHRSDHTILDVQNCKHDYKVGDVVEFDLCYATIVYATNSQNVDVVYI